MEETSSRVGNSEAVEGRRQRRARASWGALVIARLKPGTEQGGRAGSGSQAVTGQQHLNEGDVTAGGEGGAAVGTPAQGGTAWGVTSTLCGWEGRQAPLTRATHGARQQPREETRTGTARTPGYAAGSSFTLLAWVRRRWVVFCLPVQGHQATYPHHLGCL